MVLAGIDAGGWFLLGSLGLGWPFAWPCTARQVADDLRRAIGEGL